MGIGEDIMQISAMINEQTKDPFDSVSKEDLKKRGYTDQHYGLWIGRYNDGSVRSREYALNWAKEMYAKHGNSEGEIRVYKLPLHATGVQMMTRAGELIFPMTNEAKDPFDSADPKDIKVRKDKQQEEIRKEQARLLKDRQDIQKVVNKLLADAGGKIEIEFIEFPIGKDHDADFWYDGDVAKISYPEKGRVLTLTAQGEKRITFQDTNEHFRNWAAVEAADSRGYTDKDLYDEDKIYWENNNWFEFWYEGPGFDSPEDIMGDVMGSYTEGLESAVTILLDDDWWDDQESRSNESISEQERDPFDSVSQEDLDARPDYQRNKVEMEDRMRRNELAQQRRLVRMRTHPDQDNLVKQWAGEGRDKGKANALWVDRDVLWSYYTPIAIRDGVDIYVVNQRFSPTTSRHQSRVRQLQFGEVHEVSPAEFRERLQGVAGWNGSYGWLSEAKEKDPFDSVSDEDLEKRGALQYQPRRGNFPYKFMKYLAFDDVDTHWDVIGMGSHVNYVDSQIYFGSDEEPQFIIMYDTEIMLEDNLEPSPELTQEFKDFEGSADDWVQSKGWLVEGYGHTANQDNYYYWGDETFGYTSFDAHEDEDVLGGVVIEFRNKSMVYLGDYWDAAYTLTADDPEEDVARLFGYDHYKNLVRDIKEYRGTLTDEERDEPRDDEPTPGQYRWDNNLGGQYMESRLREVRDPFDSADPKDIKNRINRAKELRAELKRNKYNFPYTYEDMTEVLLYKRILELPNISDVTSEKRKKNRSIHFQYVNDKGTYGNDIIKDWVVAATGRIGSNSMPNFRGYDYRLRQFRRAETIDALEPLLREAYRVIFRFIKKVDPMSLALDLTPRRVAEKKDPFDSADPKDVEKREVERSKLKWNADAEVRRDIIDLQYNWLTRTGTGKWGLFDPQYDGEFKYMFNGLEELRNHLVSYHYVDWTGENDINDMTLSDLIDYGQWEVREMTPEEIELYKDSDGNMTEANDPFDSADPKDISKRIEDQQKQRERQHKERMESLGSVWRELVDILPEVGKVRDEYEGATEDLIGNYGARYDNGDPKKISFNIKIYEYDIPDEAEKKLDQYKLWDTFGSWIQEDRANQLEWFMEGLQEKYPFIVTYYVEGRSGGWLVLELTERIGGYYTDDIDNLIVDAEEWINPEEDYGAYSLTVPSEVSVKEDLDYFKGYIAAVNTRIADLTAIENEVDDAKDSVRMMYDKEWFDGFFESNADEEELDECQIRKAILEEIDVRDPFDSVTPEQIQKRREEQRKYMVTEEEIDELGEDILAFARNEAEEIYSSLQKAYDEDTSDENVAEHLKVNEFEFEVDEKDGKLTDGGFGGEGTKQVLFDDLDEEDQQTAIDQNRDSVAEFSGDTIGEDLNGYSWKDKETGVTKHENGWYQDELEKKGFENPDINYSGFWSQGDGACFSCHLNVFKIVKAAKIDLSPKVQKAVDAGLFYGDITSGGRYYHSNTMDIEFRYEGDEWE